MNYLNDRITQRIDLGTTQSRGMYKYEILCTEFMDQSGYYTVFVGNYYNSGTRYHTFDITDFVRSRKSNPLKSHTTGEWESSHVTIYKIRVTVEEGLTVTGAEIPVAHVYTYPNVPESSWNKTSGSSVFFEPNATNKYQVSLLLQGFNRYQHKCYLTPHYPHLRDAQDYGYECYPFGMALEVGSGVTDQAIRIIAVEKGEDPDDASARLCSIAMDHISYSDYTHFWYQSIGEILYNCRDVLTDVEIYLYNGHVDNYSLIGIVDACHPRYYLQWQDRFGSFQCQPFSDTTKYTEGIENDETRSYTNIRRKSHVTVQPKWHINSGWIPEDHFVWYESLFISPFLKLIDSYTGHVYDVMVKSDFTQKTFKDEKKMLNISLDIEATEQQNIIY